MKKVFLLAFLVCAAPMLVQAQFNSGSTGADGALDLSIMTCPNNVCEVQLPESGILNYITVNVPQGKYLRFKQNSRNTPVILLAQGNVIIAGEIDVSSPCSPNSIGTPCSQQVPSSSSIQTAGPGGFSGGAPGKDGFGPGKGIYSANNSQYNAVWVGALTLVPIVGGSGGASYNCGIGFCVGGGGGGAIAIASSTSITVPGQLKANGYGGTGSGGAIRLVANTINVSGNLSAAGNNNGVIRLESQLGQLTFNGSSFPAATLAPINPSIVSNAQPLLTIHEMV